MRYLHSINIIHHDLKPGNILLDDEFRPKIKEFEISVVDGLDEENLRSYFALNYAPLEAFDEEIVTTKFDVYSFGLILYEIATGNEPFPKIDGFAKLIGIKKKGELNEMPSTVNEFTRSLIERCISVNPDDRPSFDEIIVAIKRNGFCIFGQENTISVSLYASELDHFDNAQEHDDIIKEGEDVIEVDLKFEMPSADSVSDLILDVDALEMVKEIGEGGFGKVFLMNNCLTGRDCAVKFINPSQNRDEKAAQHFMNEIEILKMAIHPCIVRIIGYSLWSDDDKSAKIALEYVRNGTLSSHISMLSDTQKAIVVIGVCYGMRYLHSLDIIHRDLKPENILLDDQFRPRITDFGISKFDDLGLTTTTSLGTPIYAAPEAFDEGRENITSKVDVCSFGFFLFELTSNDSVYPKGISKNQLLGMKLKGKMNDIPTSVNDFTHSLINACTSFNPSDRPTFDDIIKQIKLNQYNLFGGENSNEVRSYCLAIEKIESVLFEYYSSH